MNKILVIEDDEQVRGSVWLSLESARYVVMEAATCQEGLQSHKQFASSVIISDAVSLKTKEGKYFVVCDSNPPTFLSSPLWVLCRF